MKFFLIILFIAPSKPYTALRDFDYIEYSTPKSRKFFDIQDVDYDVALISRLRKCLDDLENVIRPSPERRSKQIVIEPPASEIEEPLVRAESIKTNGIFTSFVNELALILLELNTDDLHKFVEILNNEMKTYFSPNAIIFHKIVFDPRLEAYIMNTLKEWKDRNPELLQKDLNKMMKNNIKTAFGKFADTINFIFHKNDGAKLKRILQKYYKGTEVNMKKDVLYTEMISDSLKFFLSHKYKRLNFLDKTVLSSAITYLADYLSTFYHSKTIFEIATVSPRKELNDTIINSDELHSKRSGTIAPTLPLAGRNSLEEVLKDSSIEAPVKKEPESKPVNGVIQFDQHINIKVNNVIKNNTTTTNTTTTIDYYGNIRRDYTILPVQRNTRRRYLGNVVDKRHFRRNFVHGDFDDEFLQPIEDNTKTKTADHEFTGSSEVSKERRYSIPNRDKDNYYNLHYDDKGHMFDKKVLESEEDSFMSQDASGPNVMGHDAMALEGPPHSGRLSSLYRNFMKMA